MNYLKSNTVLQSIIWFFCFSMILAWIGADNLYTADSLVKLFQAKSLIQNGFLSEKLIYPAVDFDPEYNFYFFGNGMTLPFHGYLIGQYPLIFSVILSLAVSILPINLLSYFSLLFSGLVFYFFTTEFKINNKQKTILALCTPLFYMSFDLSEHAFLLLMQIPFLVSYFSETENSKFIPSLIFGFAAWLRLEVVVFASCFYLVLLIIKYKFNIIKFIKDEFLSLLGFSIALITIAIIFSFMYGHPLGTRYLLNSSGYINSVSHKLSIFIGLLFAGNMKFGFYLVSMYFLVISIFCFFNYQVLNTKEKILFLTSFFFTVLVGLLSPFDAVRGWGSRFLFLAILPYSILFISISERIRQSKRHWSWLIKSAIAWSGFATLLGILIVFATAKHMQKLRAQLDGLNADLIVFSDEYTTPYFSLNFIDKKAILISNNDKYEKFKNKINLDNNIESFLYIFPNVSDQLKSALVSQTNEFSASQNINDSMMKDFSEIERIEKKDFVIYRYSSINRKSDSNK